MRRVVLLALFFVARAAGSAQDEGQTGIDAGVGSEHVFRGVKRAGAVAEAGAHLAGDGWRAKLRYWEPARTGEPGEGNLAGGYGWRASEQVRLDVGLRQVWSSRPRPAGTRQSTEAGVSAIWAPQQNLEITVAGFHDFRLQADTLEFSAAYSQALPALGVYLEWKAYAGSALARNLLPDTGGPDLRDNYTYYGADLRLPYHLPVGGATLTLGLHVAGTSGQNRAWSPIAATGGLHAWAELGLGFEF